MKTLNSFLIEALSNKKPKDLNELKSLVKNLLKERGENANLNDIDTSNITDMSYLFEGLNPGQIKIEDWDVSNVTNMSGMFYDCTKFNSDLSIWNVSNVTNMRAMFCNCKQFSSDLSKWDVRNVRNMRDMFENCNRKVIPSWYKD